MFERMRGHTVAPSINSMRGHAVAPSVSSAIGAGVAGQGAFKYQQGQGQQQQPYQDQQYTDAAPQMTQAQQPQTLQPRPQYTFGQSYDTGNNTNAGAGEYEMHDEAHAGGAYSVDPQAQGSYDPEIYSGYHAYEPEASYSSGAHASELHSGAPRRSEENPYGGI